MRTCSLCSAPDRPHIIADQCSCGGRDAHADGCTAVQHFVAKDIRFHAGQITLAMAGKGWTALGLFQGKQAIQRLLCRNCIRQQDEVIEIEAYRKKKGLEAEGTEDMNMYQILCS